MAQQIITRPKGKLIRRIGETANFTLVIPKGHAIENIFYNEYLNAAITGGLRIGTAAAGTQVVTAQAVSALGIGRVAQASITLSFFSLTVDQTLYVEAVTAWNSAGVHMFFPLVKLVP